MQLYFRLKELDDEYSDGEITEKVNYTYLPLVQN